MEKQRRKHFFLFEEIQETKERERERKIKYKETIEMKYHQKVKAGAGKGRESRGASFLIVTNQRSGRHDSG